MAQNASLEGLRSQLVTQIYGRRLGLSAGNSSDTNAEYLVGPRAFRDVVGGVSSAGSSITSTDVTSIIPAYGVTLVGATGASATTAYQLAAPVPGVRKTLFNPTSGNATVLVSGAGAVMDSTASNALVSMKLNAAGAFVELIGLTTAVWGIINVSQISTGGIGVTFA